MVAPIVSTVIIGGKVIVDVLVLNAFGAMVTNLVLSKGMEMYDTAEAGQGLRKLAAIATIVAGCALGVLAQLIIGSLAAAALGKLGFLVGGPVGATVGLVTACALTALGLVYLVVDSSLYLATGKNIICFR